MCDTIKIGGKVKVYCKNCKYMVERRRYDLCKARPVKKENYFMKWTEFEYCKNYNSNNECVQYVRSWWKFWVKNKV